MPLRLPLWLAASTHGDERKSALALLAVAVVAAALIYLNSLDGDFVYDDECLVVTNGAVRSLSWANIKHIFSTNINGTYRPLRVLSYALDFRAWGRNPFRFHLTNLAFHVANTILLFGLVFLVFGDYLAAALVALLFAVHPMQSECVVWISGRKDVQGMFFLLLALIFYILWRKHGTHRSLFLGISLFAYALGLLTKEHNVVLVGLLFLYEFCEARSIRGRAILRASVRALPFVLLTVLFLYIYFGISGGRGRLHGYHGGTPYATVLLIIKAMGFYIAKILFPLRLSVDYGTFAVPRSALSPAVIASACVCVAMVVAAVLCVRRAPWVTFGIGWFFIVISPVSNLVPIVTKVAERYLYMSAAGIHIAVAFALYKWLKTTRQSGSLLRRKVALGLTVALFAMLACRVVLRNEDWANERTLWTAVLRRAPRSDDAHYTLGRFYQAVGKASRDKAVRGTCFAIAESHFKLCFRFNPRYGRALVGLAHLRLDSGKDSPEVERLLLKAAEIGRNDGIVQADLGWYYFQRQQYEKAVRFYKRAIEAEPFQSAFYKDLGRSHLHAEKPDAAIEVFRQLLARNPTAVWILGDIGSAYLFKNDYPRAVRVLRKALRYYPMNKFIAHNLAYAYEQIGEYGAALSVYKRVMRNYPDTIEYLLPRRNVVALKLAIERQGDSPTLYMQLGQALAAVGRMDEALGAVQKAVSLDPGSALVRASLAGLYLSMRRIEEAEKTIAEALQLDAEEPQVWFVRAEVYAARGRARDAVECLRKAVALGGEGFKIAARQVRIFDAIRQSPEFQAFMNAPSETKREAR